MLVSRLRCILSLMLCSWSVARALKLGVTGAHGYLGAEVCWQAVEQGHEVRAIGKHARHLPAQVELFEVDDLKDAVTARAAAEGLDAVIHTASVFRSCDDMEQELVLPNIALAEQMVCACAASGARLILTSSMAAVRGAGQAPKNGLYYTSRDWNTVSRRDGPGFEPYQWSKMASEQRAWELAREVGLELVTLCPPMIFGPPRDATCTSFSVQMVRKWARGEAAVRSLLVSDVRDVALAHVRAATEPAAAGGRFIVSTEQRSDAASEADAIRRGLRAQGCCVDECDRVAADESEGSGDGLIAVGDREVDVETTTATLGVQCRSSHATLEDMAARIRL